MKNTFRLGFALAIIAVHDVSVAADKSPPANSKQTSQKEEITVVRPLKLQPHPRLMITDAEIVRINDSKKPKDLLGNSYNSLMRSADGFVKKQTDLPPRGGQWYHWYACRKDGGSLKTVSPTEHKCQLCGTVYSGQPYDDVVLMGIHGSYSRAIRDLALAYRFSGKFEYADKAREILLAYAEKYQSYPLHDKNGKEKTGGGKVGPQTLDEAVWLIPVCQGADLIWDRLSTEEQKKVETGLIRPAVEVIRNHKIGIHNIQCWKNSAVGLAGLLLGDPALVADAVDSKHGYYRQIAEGVNSDGQWYEGAWGYHFYTISAMVPLLEAGERCGLNLYAFNENGHSFASLLEGPIKLAMPNMTLPAFNDSGQVKLAGSEGVYELGLARYKNPLFAELLRNGKRGWLEPLLTGGVVIPDVQDRVIISQNYTNAGYAILRSGPDAISTWLCLKYGPHGGGHGHPDKLNFVLYSKGKVLGYDPGTGKYGVPIHQEWQKATIAHNTLTVDETNQKPATGSCLAFISRPDYSAALADAGPIYDGVNYQRAAAVIGSNVVLVLDIVNADKDHTFDLAYHNAGKWTADPAGQAVKMPEKPSYGYFEKMVQPAGSLPAIVCDPVTVGLSVVSVNGGEMWAGNGVGNNVREKVPCVIARVKGKQAVVAWAFDLGGTVPVVKVVPVGTGWGIEAVIGGKTYRMVADPKGTEKLKVL